MSSAGAEDSSIGSSLSADALVRDRVVLFLAPLFVCVRKLLWSVRIESSSKLSRSIRMSLPVASEIVVVAEVTVRVDIADEPVAAVWILEVGAMPVASGVFAVADAISEGLVVGCVRESGWLRWLSVDICWSNCCRVLLIGVN